MTANSVYIIGLSK